MNERLSVLALAGASAILVIAIAGEMMFSEVGTPDSDHAPARGAPADASRPDALAEPPAAPILLARPLFSPARRPSDQPHRADAVNEGPAELPRLSGILISGADRKAVFQPAHDDKAIVVGEGEEISGYRLKTIDPTGVILVGPDGEQTVAPRFDPNAAAPAVIIPPRRAQPVRTSVPPGGQPNVANGGGPISPLQPPVLQRPGILPPLPPALQRGNPTRARED